MLPLLTQQPEAPHQAEPLLASGKTPLNLALHRQAAFPPRTGAGGGLEWFGCVLPHLFSVCALSPFTQVCSRAAGPLGPITELTSSL